MLSAVVGWMIVLLVVLCIAGVFAVFMDERNRNTRMWWIMGLMAPVIMLLLIALNITTRC